MDAKDCTQNQQDCEQKPGLLAKIFGTEEPPKEKTYFEGVKDSLSSAKEGVGDMVHKIGGLISQTPPPKDDKEERIVDEMREKVAED